LSGGDTEPEPAGSVALPGGQEARTAAIGSPAPCVLAVPGRCCPGPVRRSLLVLPAGLGEVGAGDVRVASLEAGVDVVEPVTADGQGVGMARKHAVREVLADLGVVARIAGTTVATGERFKRNGIHSPQHDDADRRALYWLASHVWSLSVPTSMEGLAQEMRPQSQQAG